MVRDDDGFLIDQHQNINSSMGNPNSKMMHFAGSPKSQFSEAIDPVVSCSPVPDASTTGH
jgi:hypothetical protein